MKPKEQLVHTNLSLFYMKSGDKETAEKHGLKARIAGWGSDMKPPGQTGETDEELKIAQPEAKSISVTGKKFPDQPWEKEQTDQVTDLQHEIRLRTRHGTARQIVAHRQAD